MDSAVLPAQRGVAQPAFGVRAPSSMPTVSLYGSTTAFHDLNTPNMEPIRPYAVGYTEPPALGSHTVSRADPLMQTPAGRPLVPSGSNAPPSIRSISLAPLAGPPPTRPEQGAGVSEREQLIAQQQQRLQQMHDDYLHNLKVLSSREEEIKTLTDQRTLAERRCTALHDDLSAANGRIDALTEALQEVEAAQETNTKHLREELEATKAQMVILLEEKSHLQRIVSEREMTGAAVKEELQRLRSTHAHQLETERRRIAEKHEVFVEELRRAHLHREEQLHADKKKLETRNAELHTECSKAKEALLQSDLQREEVQRLAAARDAAVNQLQQQLNDVRRLARQREADLDGELATLRAARENAERSALVGQASLARDVEKRLQEKEVLEQKLQSVRLQHEADLKRRAEVEGDQLRGAEEKARTAAERQREAEHKLADQLDLVERLRRQNAELKREKEHLEGQGLVTRETIDELTRGNSRRDQLLEKAQHDIAKLTNLLHERDKEVNITRLEMARREQHDLAASDQSLAVKNERWKSSFAAMDASGRVIPADQLAVSLVPAPMHHQSSSNENAAGGPMNAQATLELLSEIKGQLHQQRERSGGNPHDSSRLNASNVNDYYSVLETSHSASRAANAQLRRELAAMRENYVQDREELEERLQEALRQATRERRKNEPPAPSSPPAAMKAQPSERPVSGVSTVSAASGGAAAVPESPSLQRLRDLQTEFNRKRSNLQ